MINPQGRIDRRPVLSYPRRMARKLPGTNQPPRRGEPGDCLAIPV